MCVGGACAVLTGQFGWLPFLLALIGSVALQAGTNLTNDYHDHRLGADHSGSLGPSRVIQLGWISPRAMLRAGLLAFAIGCACGLALAAIAGWPILLIGLVGVPLAYAYTAPPLKLAYRGLGEATVFVLMGPLMVVGTYLTMARDVEGVRIALLLAIPIGLHVAAILHANNIRDLADDRALGKRTLATIVGLDWAKREYDALVWGAFALTAAYIATGLAPWTSVLVVLSLPAAFRASRVIRVGQAALDFAGSVKQTAAVHAQFGLLVALGTAIARLLV